MAKIIFGALGAVVGGAIGMASGLLMVANINAIRVGYLGKDDNLSPKTGAKILAPGILLGSSVGAYLCANHLDTNRQTINVTIDSMPYIHGSITTS